jgi:hypothetical protein
MKSICQKYPKLDSEFQRYRLGIMKAAKNMPLDYIMVLPKVIMKKILI